MKSLILTTCLILILLGMSVATTAQQQETSNVGDVAIFTGNETHIEKELRTRGGKAVNNCKTSTVLVDRENIATAELAPQESSAP